MGERTAPSEVTLLERGPALGAVAATIGATRGGEYSVLFVVGEAGLGKTSLIAHAKSAASGLALGSAEGVAAETALPFGLLGQALVPLRDIESVPGLGSAEARARLYQRCSRALRDLCQASPLLLLIDDLHWADPDSLALLGFLLRRLRDSALGLIATLRPWPPEAAELAEELAGAGRAEIQRLAPLSGPSSALVAKHAAQGRLAPAQLEQVLASCAGNPFLLTQAGAMGAAWAGSGPIGHPTHRLVARFSGLTPEVLRIAKAASVAGTRFWPQLVSAITGSSDAEVSSALSTLISAGLARAQSDGEVEFAHPLFAQALYDTTEAPERSRLHALAMRALLTLGAEPAQAAAHAIAGRLLGDTVAVDTLCAAGRAALSLGALHSAVKLLSAAVDLTGRLAEPSLLLDLAEAELAIGQQERAQEVCEHLLERSPDKGTQARALLMLARRAYNFRSKECLQLYTEAVEAAEGTDHGIDVLAEAVMVCARGGPRRVAAWSHRLRTLSAGLSATKRIQVDLAWGIAAALAGDPSGTEAVCSAVGLANVASLMRSAAPAAFPFMLAAGFEARLWAERFEEADELVNVAWQVAERQGAFLLMRTLAQIRAAVCWHRGHIATSRRILEENTAIERDTEYPDEAARGSMLPIMIALEEDDVPGAAFECAQLERVSHEGHTWRRVQLWRVEADLALDAGRPAEAAKLGRHIRDLIERVGLLEPCYTPWADTVMIAFVRSGSLEEAEALVEHLDMVSCGLSCRWPRSVAAFGRAGLAEAGGDLAQAEHYHRQAVELLEGVDLPLRRARALLTYGRFLRRNRQPALARRPLSRAVEESMACGGARLAAQALTELKASGGRQRRQSSRQLSTRERSVTALAIEGATNEEIASRLFISVKTVEHHLTSAYLKMGIRSRKELPKHLEAP